VEARSKFDKACAILLRKYPFWGSLILDMAVVEDGETETMATDGVSIFYNPDYVLGQDTTIVATDIAHKGGHRGFFHNTRRGTRGPLVWNFACDYVINIYLSDNGLKLGDDFLFDPAYRGMDAEVVYNLLIKNPQTQPKPNRHTSDVMDHPGNKKDRGEGQQDGKQRGKNGSSGKNTGRQGTEPAMAGQPTTSQTEAATHVALSKSRSFAKAAGKCPGSVDRAVEAIINPRIPIEDYLQQFFEKTAMSDYSWEMPSRTHLHLGLYLPGMESEEISELVFVIDTSVSITKAVLDLCAGAVSRALATLPIKQFHIIYCDAKVQKAEIFTQSDLPIQFKPVGGGGTNFVPPFKYLEERCIDPKALVYLTDLECHSFPVRPAYPVLWAVHGGKRTVPFGEVLPLDN
jgi:predicted metal-dependent peptidase